VALEPLRADLTRLGLAGSDLELWFARALRDAFAQEVCAAFRPFSEVLRTELELLLRERGASPDGAADVVARFAELPLHPDVRPALEEARDRGARVAVVTNGAAKTTRAAFARAALDRHVTDFISIDDVGHFKPAREVYLHAARVLGVEPGACVLVAAHPWDLRGAHGAGMAAAFVERRELLPHDLAEDVIAVARSLERVIQAIVGRAGSG
jgi:2-haloacid dehalogenase